MTKRVYYHGVALWQHLRYWEVVASRQGEMTLTGVKQLRGRLNPESPNFLRDITVRTTIAPVSAVDDLTQQATVHAALLQVENNLLAVADELGPLSWVEDISQKANVTGGPHTGDNAVVTHGAAGGSWTREVGHYVLARNPTNGQGFVAIIEAVDSSATDVTIDIPSGYSVTSAWDLVNVAFHIPDCAYIRRDPGTPEQVGSDKWRAEVLYIFQGKSDPVFATDYNIDLDET